MTEIFKVMLQYKEAGVALFFAILFYFDFRKKIMSLDKTITNHLTHAIEDLTKIIQKLVDKK